MPLDPPLEAFLAMLADKPHLADGSPEEGREAMRKLAAYRDSTTVPEVDSVDELAVPGPAGDVPARLYRPRTDGGLPTVVLVHGGGWVIGDLGTHDTCARRLATECDGDPLRDEGAAYAQALDAAGVETALRSYDGLIHGFLDMDWFSPASREAVLDRCRPLKDLIWR